MYKNKKVNQRFSCFPKSLRFCKKGISTVVATVLIILITVAAVTIIWSAVVPMIRENLEGGSACLDAVSQISIVGTQGYTCVTSDGTVGVIKVQIKRGAKGFNLADIQMIVTTAEGDTHSSYLLDDEDDLWGENTLEDLPGQNEEKVFTSGEIEEFDGAERISIAPLVGSGASKNPCEISSSFDLIPCEEETTT